MIPPIIAVSTGTDGDVLVFGTLERAIEYLEPVDVRESEYAVYDGEGRLLRASADSDAGPVRITEAERVPTHQDPLRRALVSLLAAQPGGNIDTTASTLPDLVNRCLEFRIR